MIDMARKIDYPLNVTGGSESFSDGQADWFESQGGCEMD